MMDAPFQRRALAVAVASAMMAPIAAQAVSFKISGHVNRAVRWLDDGDGSDIQNVDNGGSRTRLRFVGSEKVGGLEAGVNLEIGFSSNRTTTRPSKFSGDGDGGDSFDGGDDIRHSALYFKGNWGTVWLGHSNGAAENKVHNDLSGTSIVDTPFSDDAFAVAFRTSGGGCPTAGGGVGATAGAGCLFVRDAFNSLDGSRLDGLRYVSPWLGPVNVEVSVHNNDRWEASANAKSNLAGGKIQGSIAYIDARNSAGFESFSGSASFLFSQGTSITLAASNRDFTAAGSNDASYWFVKLGHRWGNNRVSASYWNTDSADSSAGVGQAYDGDAFSVAFVHVLPKLAAELYAEYNHYEVDAPSGSAADVAGIEDIDAVMVGARVKFR